jgi:signal transduction histidine kinase/CheY-like chemotaxis protein
MASLSSIFTFWGVDIRTDQIERLLKYDTIWDTIGVDANTPYTHFLHYVIEGREDAERMVEQMRNGTLQSWNGDLLFQTPTGQKWFRNAISASSSIHYNCFMLDITEQKEMERQLVRSQELRDMMLSHAKIFLWTFLEKAESLSLPQAHTIQMNWEFIDREVATESRDDFREAVRNALESQGTIDSVILLGQNWYSVRGRFSGDGNRLVGICCDITELKQAYIDLAKEQERAQAANRAKTVFLTNMSHEIRTPMNGIIGMLDVLAMHELSVEQRLLTDAIRSSSFELMKQLSQTLSMQQIERGTIELNNEVFDISKSLEAVAVAAATRAKMSNISLTFRISPNFPILIYGEAQIFLQIVNNLMSNAMKFTKQGGISLYLNWELEPKEMLILEVADTGIGMSDEQKHMIFNRFMQADPSIARFYGGTGLGLALVRRLIEELGGTITFDTELGKGTKFHVRLPFESIAFPCPRPFPAGAKHEIIVGTNKDDVDQFLQDFITFYGYEIVYVFNIGQLRKAMRPTVEAVLIDIERSGKEAIPMRNFIQQKYPNLLLCSISSPGMASDFPRALTKPLLPAPLRQLLDDLRYHLSAAPAQVGPSLGDVMTGRKVLVVEDNKINQLVMSKMLKTLNVSFTLAENGEVALEKLEAEDFDMVFMDCQMPVMDGLEASRRIRTSEKRYSNIPIVALTASAIEGDEEQCRDAGMDAYLAKPVRLEQIAQAVKTFAVQNC